MASPTTSVAPFLEVTEPGLTMSEVHLRLARGEVNRVSTSVWATYRDILVRNLFTLFNLLVVPAAIALVLLEDWRAGWAVSGMAILNTVIGLVQEIRAKRWLDQLSLLAEPPVHVRRDGSTLSIRAGDVVRGDILFVQAGEAIVADGPVLAAQDLEVDEALLTGESDPVAKSIGDTLLSGSACLAGWGVYRAERIGAEAFAQRLTIQARSYHHTLSPLQRTLNRLIQILTVITLVLALCYVGLYLVGRVVVADMWRMIAATVTSMVPQGLVLMTTLVLTLGALRLSRRGAIVQRLAAVESMAAVDVLCLDKTGTLTTGRLRLDRLVPLVGDEVSVRSLLQKFAWASLDTNTTIEALREVLAPPSSPLQVLERVPFRSHTRFSAVTWREEHREKTCVLGAVDALLPFVQDSDRVRDVWQDLLATGLRVLLLAESPQRRSEFAGSWKPQSLRAIGLLALADELRPEAGQVLSELAAEGIRFKILSGDHPATVRAAVAPVASLLDNGPLVTGHDVTHSPDRSTLISHATVFGRVDPQQKLEIVTELQRKGHHVGMVGDGINDLLVIKQADLGIAMGSGTAAARTVADLVLAHDDFTLLPQTLREGRTIVNNVRRAAKLFLTKNVFTLLLIVVGFTFMDGDFPYLPQQVTLLNALTIGVPAMLLIGSRCEHQQSRGQSLLKEAGIFALGSGLSIGVAAATVWLLSAHANFDLINRRTLLLTTLVLSGLANAWVISEAQRRVVLWCFTAGCIYTAVMYTPMLADFFVITPLPWSLVWKLLALAFLTMMFVWLLNHCVIVRSRRFRLMK
jgi:cation-transporting ATPase E